MKYWFFDGNDVVGPFSPQELLRRKDFSAAASLVCPENFSEDEDSWKTASSFADFQPSSVAAPAAAAKPAAPNGPEPEPSSQEEAALFDKEMDTFLKNPSILAGTAEPAPDGPPLEIPKKPAKPGPIEDYFNNINGKDLGDILGIPDPNENSDMNLARALEGQFEQTAPPTDKEIDAAELADEEPEEDETDSSEEAETAADHAETAADEMPAEQQAACAPQPPAPEAKPQTEESPVLPEQKPSAPVLKEPEPVVPVPMSQSEEEPLLVLPGEQLPERPQSVSPEQTQEEEKAEEAAQTAQPSHAENAGQAVQTPESEHAPESAPEEMTAQPVPVPAGPDPLAQSEPSTCTLPLIRVGESVSQLPAMPEGDVVFEPEREPLTAPEEAVLPEDERPFEPEPAPAVRPQEELSPQQDFAREKELPAQEISVSAQPQTTEAEELVPSAAPLKPEEMAGSSEIPVSAERTHPQASAPEDPKEQTVRDILRGQLTLPAEEELKEPLKTVPVEPEVNQVKPKLNQTPEIEQFLDTQSRVLRRSRNKKAGFMLWVLAALLALGVIFAAMRLFASADPEENSLPAPADVSAVPAPVVPAPSVPVRAALETRPVQPVVPAAPKPRPSASDRAMAAVQNYRLPEGKGTIASYFDRLYAARLEQGFTGAWSAEPLHKNIYIVKYRLSKTRMEPIVYVFQADAAQNKLTGALNNAALDLVGKI